MTAHMHTSRSSLASPGQGARRDRLTRLYDELGDVAKQELLQFAEDLSDEAQHPSAAEMIATARFRSVPGRWDNDCVLFAFQDGNRRISCSVSRQALEAAGPGRGARRWQLMEVFERLRTCIEGIARDKFASAPETSCVIEVLAADLAAGLDVDPAARAAALRRRAGEC